MKAGLMKRLARWKGKRRRCPKRVIFESDGVTNGALRKILLASARPAALEIFFW